MMTIYPLEKRCVALKKAYHVDFLGGIFSETVGVALEEGSKWKQIRSQVQPYILKPDSGNTFVIMSPNAISFVACFYVLPDFSASGFYLDKINVVADDFVKHLKNVGTSRGSSSSVDAPIFVDDFLKECKKFSFEAIASVATDKRLGVLQANKESKCMELLKTRITMYFES